MAFYDELADYYHLIFEDWDRSIERQAATLGPILKRCTGKTSPSVLDCACGIGTQALGLAQRGHAVVASDLSAAAIERARVESERRGVAVAFYVADMRELSGVPGGEFDAILAADNALPHLLSQGDLIRALREMAGKLSKNGVLLATLRDYDSLILSRPAMQPPAFYNGADGERIVHQVWRWRNEEYDMHLYLTLATETGWLVKHFSTTYRALLRQDLNDALDAAGFGEVEWLEPSATSFYQPIVVARAG